LDSVSKINDFAKILCYFFPRQKIYVTICAIIGFGHILGDFTTSSTGHLECDQFCAPSKNICEKTVKLESMLRSQFSAIFAYIRRKNWRFSQKPML
jgi:hypothetical protein